MMSTNSIAYIGLLFILLGNLGTIECMRQFAFLIGYLTDVMQQAGSLCFLGIQAEFACHNGT